MGLSFDYPAYAIKIKIKKHKSRRSCVSFGDACSEIEFIEACFSKLVISLRKFIILRSQSQRYQEEILEMMQLNSLIIILYV